MAKEGGQVSIFDIISDNGCRIMTTQPLNKDQRIELKERPDNAMPSYGTVRWVKQDGDLFSIGVRLEG